MGPRSDYLDLGTIAFFPDTLPPTLCQDTSSLLLVYVKTLSLPPHGPFHQNY